MTLHRPLKPSGTVVSKTRVTEIIDKGPGQGRRALFRAHHRRQGERRTHRQHPAHHVLPRRRRLRRAAARAAAAASDSGARARSRLRPADAAGDGADLPALRRPQPAARRPRGGEGGRLPAADPARACDLRRRRPRAAQERLRLRSCAADCHRRALLGAGVSGRDHPHRDLARRRGGELPLPVVERDVVALNNGRAEIAL